MRNHSLNAANEKDPAMEILKQVNAVEVPIQRIDSCAQFNVSKETEYSMLHVLLHVRDGIVRSKIYALCVDQQPHLYYIPNGVALQDYWSIVQRNGASHHGFYREQTEKTSV